MGRQTLYGIVDSDSFRFSLVGVLYGFPESLLFVEKHGDTIVEINLIFRILALDGFLDALLIIDERGIQFSDSAIADAHCSTHGKHAIVIFNLLGKRDAFLSDFYGFSHLSKICICGHLLAGKPTAGSVGTVHIECAVYQKDGLFLITISIIVDGFQKQGICPFLVFAAVSLTSGKESDG